MRIILFSLLAMPAFAAPAIEPLEKALLSLQTLNHSQRTVLRALEQVRASHRNCEKLLYRWALPVHLDVQLWRTLEQAPQWLLELAQQTVMEGGELSPDQSEMLEHYKPHPEIPMGENLRVGAALTAQVRRGLRNLTPAEAQGLETVQYVRLLRAEMKNEHLDLALRVIAQGRKHRIRLADWPVDPHHVDRFIVLVLRHWSLLFDGEKLKSALMDRRMALIDTDPVRYAHRIAALGDALQQQQSRWLSAFFTEIALPLERHLHVIPVPMLRSFMKTSGLREFITDWPTTEKWLRKLQQVVDMTAPDAFITPRHADAVRLAFQDLNTDVSQMLPPRPPPTYALFILVQETQEKLDQTKPGEIPSLDPLDWKALGSQDPYYAKAAAYISLMAATLSATERGRLRDFDEFSQLDSIYVRMDLFGPNFRTPQKVLPYNLSIFRRVLEKPIQTFLQQNN